MFKGFLSQQPSASIDEEEDAVEMKCVFIQTPRGDFNTEPRVMSDEDVAGEMAKIDAALEIGGSYKFVDGETGAQVILPYEVFCRSVIQIIDYSLVPFDDDEDEDDFEDESDDLD